MSLRRPVRLAVASLTLITLCGLGAQEASAWPWPWINPEIYNSGRRFSGVRYDPFTGRVVVQTDRTRVRESVLDPHRGHIDPGSRRYVDEIRVDSNGVRWHVRGWQWTSHGVPHGDLRRTRVRSTPWGVDHEENDRVLYSQQVDPDDMPGQPLRDTPQRRDLPEQSERLNPGRLNPNLQQQIDPQMLRRRATIREF
jgi:hypothetical protein